MHVQVKEESLVIFTFKGSIIWIMAPEKDT